jgi:hypothetical protein
MEKPQLLIHILSWVLGMKVSAEPEKRDRPVRRSGEREITKIKLTLAET